MQESHSEGVANHTDPELCVASREAGDEALAGARAGQVLSPESTLIGVPTSSPRTEGHALPIVMARWAGTLRGRRSCACTETPRTRTGRSQASVSTREAGGERSGKFKDARR
jgi:hypothetical protein